MIAHISYAEIPKAERKRLATEVYRRKPGLHAISFAAFLVAIPLSGPLVEWIAPKEEWFSVHHLAVRVLCTVGIAVVIWEGIGRRRVKSEIEKLKNG